LQIFRKLQEHKLSTHEIKQENLWINSVPMAIFYKHTPEKAGTYGTILFYHGLKSSKEGNTKELRELAEKGFLAAGIDNAGHGERCYTDLDSLMASGNFFQNVFLDMVRKTAGEVPVLIDELAGRGWSKPDRIGVCGISMGGYIAYSAVTIDPRIKAAVPILGSPKWTSENEDSPHKHPHRFFPTALLAQNAGMDLSVPPMFARAFNGVLKPYYKDMPERLKYIEFPDSGHFMLEHDWNYLWTNTLEWFEKFLPV
jgi:uncharacterized protein